MSAYTDNKRNERNDREGAALVIVLGFLAILTVTIIAFTTQTRTDRISGRSYVSSAQTTHLLNTALTRAMAEIDDRAATNYFPRFTAFSSRYAESPDHFIMDSEDLSMQEDFFPYGNDRLRNAYRKQRKIAEWQPVYFDSAAVGRLGYIVVNTSGLLDANETGGTINRHNYRPRRSGTSPAEIQLSNDPLIIDELNREQELFPHISPETPEGTARRATDADLSPGLALVHNREQAWKHFETTRDIIQLSNIGSPIFEKDIASFTTYSYDPRKDRRIFMGTNAATLNLDAVINELPASVSSDFFINQLSDYVDTDTHPEDRDGNYTDYSVEPVPLINEVIFEMGLTFIPVLMEEEDGSTELESIIVSNNITLNIEVWYPFTGYTNSDVYGIGFTGIDFNTANALPDLSTELLGNLLDWNDSTELDHTSTIPGYGPISYDLYKTNIVIEVNPEKGAILALFDELSSDVIFTEIYCTNLTQNQKADSVNNLALEFKDYIPTIIEPEIAAIESNLFQAAEYEIYTNAYAFGKAVIDPRLNWDGMHSNQWAGVDNDGYYETFPTLNDRNSALIDLHDPVDPPDLIYIRNEDRIDTPYEFTYLLYSEERPWSTLPLFPRDDAPPLNEIVKNLSPYNGNHPTKGRINPYTPHQNILAAAFMGIAVNEYDPAALKTLNAEQANEMAGLFMSFVDRHGWPETAAGYGRIEDVPKITEIIEDARPWAVESVFRKTYELFNPRDTQFAVFLIAQSGIDTDGNGWIDDDEVQSTQQAVSYIWRDPETGKAAPFFFGYQDSLMKSTDKAGSLSDLLRAFEP